MDKEALGTAAAPGSRAVWEAVWKEVVENAWKYGRRNPRGAPAQLRYRFVAENPGVRGWDVWSNVPFAVAWEKLPEALRKSAETEAQASKLGISPQEWLAKQIVAADMRKRRELFGDAESTGLGLYVVRKICELSGIKVESKLKAEVDAEKPVYVFSARWDVASSEHRPAPPLPVFGSSDL